MFSPIPSEKEQTPNKHNQIKDGYHNFGIDHNGNIIKRDFDIESYLNFDENKENESLVAVDSNGDLQKTRTFSPFKFNSNFSFSNEIEHEDNDSIKEIGLGLNNNDFRNGKYSF
ncbi:hypothetical protein PACTADRAFT_51637 [Pachysolen tannophilus NRRL Y-2460]|uniref:Uncharacterized protein n=1 Tax=Pachysolen tannophilus NRRL Y-2460 TaxID=669874 RepID=A0A1E4TQ65_PACTA|nr:hypothetical protein PACTADRAFT_51637 [Pachysolen tannophilus NRRL Y-2460]